MEVSHTSLTQKRVRTVVKNCMNIDVNPLTSSGRIYQYIGMVLLPLLPLLALTAYSSTLLVTLSSRMHALDKERVHIDTRLDVVPFVIALQREQAALVTYHSANQSEVVGTMQEFFYITDSTLEHVSPWPSKLRSFFTKI